MNKRKRLKFLAMALIVNLALNGCGKAEKSSADFENKQETTEENDSKENKIVLKIASTLNSDMDSIQVLNHMAQNVKEKSEGKVEIEIYPSSKLGDQSEYLKAVQLGTVEMCLISPTPLTEFDPNFVIFGCPGFFETSEEMEAFYKTDVVKEIFENCRKKHGIRFLGLYHEGIRDVWLTNRKIEKIEDFSGIKLRVPDVPLSIKKFEVLGTEPVAMPLSEIYMGLQTGAVDGIENNVEIITGYNLQDLIKYRVKTNHTYSTLILIANENVISQLDDDLREIIFECIDESTKEAYENFKSRQEEAYKTVENAGVVTIELSAEEKAKMNELWKQVSKEVLDGLFPESIYDVIESCKQ